MVKKLVEHLIYGTVISIGLIILGVFISLVIIGDQKSLDFILFIIGAIPVVVFLPSVYSSAKSGALHTPKVIFRKVETLEIKDRKDESSGRQSRFSSPATLVLAGLITWCVGFVL